MEEDLISEWYERFKVAHETANEKQSYAILLEFEAEIYNRALSDVYKSTPDGAIGPLLENMKLSGYTYSSGLLADRQLESVRSLFSIYRKEELYMILRGMEACIYNRALADVRTRVPFSVGAAEFSTTLLRMRLSSSIDRPDPVLH